VLVGAADGVAEALGALLPSMLCGEESAVRVFYNEGDRVGADLFNAGSRTLLRIAAEEEHHERLLRLLEEQTPPPGDAGAGRTRARRYFMSLHCRDIGEHFSRIAALDSGVCLIMHDLTRPASPLGGVATVRRMLRRIHADEARHVAFSHAYAGFFGVDARRDGASFELVRRGLVELMRPCGAAFERLGVDPDRLFARLRGRRMVAP